MSPLPPHPSGRHSGTQPCDEPSARTNPPLGPIGLLLVLIEAPAEPRAQIVPLVRYFVLSAAGEGGGGRQRQWRGGRRGDYGPVQSLSMVSVPT